jgi:hypothetical protein
LVVATTSPPDTRSPHEQHIVLVNRREILALREPDPQT